MKIELTDLKAQYRTLKAEIDAAMQSVIETTTFIGGPEVDKFEQEFASLLQVGQCISCGNGTDSLYIILKMLGIGPGDEVITAANSWISSSETISQVGATPVFVDIDPEFYTICPDRVSAAVTSRTKAIVPVHIFGQACDMDRLLALCRENDLYLVEDCAQAHLAEDQGRKVGTIGDAGSFSFYPGKNLGAYGDAGCIVTNSQDLAINFRKFARHGALIKHQHEIEGINSRLDSLQAAILRVKLRYLDRWTDQRIAHANLYSEMLSHVPQVVTPACRPEGRHVFHLYVVRVEQRDELAAFLQGKGIQTGIHYPSPLPFLPCYRHLGLNQNDFPVASRMKDEILSLPMYPELKTQEIEYIVEQIKAFYR